MSRLTAEPMKPGAQALNGTFGVDPSPARTATLGRTAKRNLPLVGLGVLLVVGCAIGFSSAWLRASGHQEVLVVSRGLSAGQVISPSDLRTAQLSVASSVASMPVSDISQVIGRPVASAVTPGTLLTESDVAQTTGPPSGRAVVGLALKPGQYPPGLAPGERVLVVFNSGAPTVSGTSATSDTNLANAPTEATVLEVDSAPANSSESLVVSIQLAEGDGATAASAASEGNVALAVISSGASS
jgi:SAF domain